MINFFYLMMVMGKRVQLHIRDKSTQEKKTATNYKETKAGLSKDF